MPRQPSTGFLAAATRLSAITLSLAASMSVLAANVVGGSGQFTTIQSAINALPASGGEVDVMPGSYHEQVIISKPNVRLIGMGQIAASTKLWNDRWAQMLGSNGQQVGDQGASTLIVTRAAHDFVMKNMDVENTYTQEGHTQTQAPAIFVQADRAAILNSRLIGRQDTAYFGSGGCTSTYCIASRQYVYNTHIEGTVDFLFGDGATVFDNCILQIDRNGSITGEATIAAQNRLYNNYLSGYVIWDSQIKSNPATGMTNAYLGRPWSSLSHVVYINTNMRSPINAAGWIEMVPSGPVQLPTSYFGEYGSTGTGAQGYLQHTRESAAVYLGSGQVQQYAPNTYLAGSDGWRPTSVK
ncbi:MAG TPA: pectinesterase family protein [Burkholderiaceae bacterium]